MKRLIIIGLMLITLCGCSKVDNTYPRLIYRPSYWSTGRQWTILDDYKLDDGHSYDIIDTENGRDIVFHFVKKD